MSFWVFLCSCHGNFNSYNSFQLHQSSPENRDRFPLFQKKLPATGGRRQDKAVQVLIDTRVQWGRASAGHCSHLLSFTEHREHNNNHHGLAEIWSLQFHRIDLLPSAITPNPSQVLILEQQKHSIPFTSVSRFIYSSAGKYNGAEQQRRALDLVREFLCCLLRDKMPQSFVSNHCLLWRRMLVSHQWELYITWFSGRTWAAACVQPYRKLHPPGLHDSVI